MLSFWEHTRFLCRMMAPGIVAVLFVILSMVNFQVHGIAMMMPVFPAMMVYYWAIYWPEVMPRWFVFLLGLLYDLIRLAPPGLSSLLLLLFWWVVTSQRRHLLKEPFVIVWLMFVVSGALYLTAEWAAQGLAAGHVFSGGNVWMRLALSALLYPLIHKMLNGLHQVVLQK